MGLLWSSPCCCDVMDALEVLPSSLIPRDVGVGGCCDLSCSVELRCRRGLRSWYGWGMGWRCGVVSGVVNCWRS